MPRSRYSKFLLAVVVGVVASVSTVQVASAYFTTHGTGSGSAHTALLSLDHVTISPQTDNVVVGENASYTVKAYDNFGGSKDVTSSADLSITHGTCSTLAMTCMSDSVGSQTVTASYDGKTTQGTLVVTPASTTTSIVSSPISPSLVDQRVTYSAHVSVNAPGAGSPTGNVAFFDGGVAIARCGHAHGKALKGSSASCTVSYEEVGSHTITAQYLGDTNFLASAISDPITQVVDQTSTATTTDLSAYVKGQSIVVTATVRPVSDGSGTPTGTVVITDGVNPAGTCTIDLTNATRCTIVEQTAGTYILTGIYSGDANFLGSSGNTDTVTVGGEGSGTVDSTTVVSDNASSPTTGASFTFTATVSATTSSSGSGTPAGSVTWTVIDPHGDSVTCPESTLVAGIATCDITNALAGTYRARAHFSATDGIFSNSRSNTDTVTVGGEGSSTILQTSPTSQTITTACETSIISVITTNDTLGTVAFTPSNDGGLAVNASGAITVTGILTEGTYVVSGTMSDTLGDTGTWTFTLNVTLAVKGNARLQLFAQNPQPLTVGDSATFTARVEILGGPNNLSGTVSFFVGGAPVGGCQSEALTVNTSTCLINFPNAGTFTVSATYANDPIFADSTDSSLQIVNRGTTSLSLSSAVPASPVSPLVYTATIVPTSGSGALRGTVTFTKDGSPLVGCLNVALAGDSASCSVPFANPGTFSIGAIYGDDPNFEGS